MTHVASFLRCCCLAALAFGSLAAAEDLLAGTADPWQEFLQQDPPSRIIRLKSTKPGEMVMLHKLIPVTGREALRFSIKVRYENVRRGSQPWFDARILLAFRDAESNKIKGAPGPIYFTGTSKGWVVREQCFAVPPEADTLEFMPCLFNAKSGLMDLDDIELEPISSEELARWQAEREAEKARKTKSKSAKPAVELVLEGGKAPPPQLRVEGNKVIDASGKEVWLQGVSIDSLQWSATGENIVGKVITAIDDWGVNVVRLPMKEDYWFGRKVGQQDGGADYRKVIDEAITACSTRGAYLIIDLHRFRAPKQVHVDFWQDCAQTYANNPAVIFELFNEPHDIPWDSWKDGGWLDAKRHDENTAAENPEELEKLQTVGMQALVDAVRDTGAKNLVLAGGLEYAYNISKIIQGYALDDRGGNGIVYVSHVYPWKNHWQRKFLDVAAVHPVIITEFGCDLLRYSFIPPSAHEDPYGWAPDIFAVIQKHKLHYTAFSFHPSCGPPMLQDEAYTPTPHWGSFAKAALAGVTFISDRMR